MERDVIAKEGVHLNRKGVKTLCDEILESNQEQG